MKEEARPGLYRGIHDLVIEVLAEISSPSHPSSGFSHLGAFRGLFGEIFELQLCMVVWHVFWSLWDIWNLSKAWLEAHHLSILFQASKSLCSCLFGKIHEDL